MHIDSFLTYIRCELNLSAHTVSSYKTDLVQWRNYCTDNKPEEFYPLDITPLDIRQWISHLANKNSSQRTIRRKIQAVRAFYNYLMKYHGLKSNPATEITLAKIDKPLPIYIRPVETNRILSETWDHDDYIETRDRLIILMFYSTGIRCSELMTLLDANVNTARGELKVLGKRNKERIIPFGEELSEMITLYRRLRDDIVESPEPQFFLRPTGEPLYRNLIYNIVHRTLSGRVHSERQSPHVLRHSFASDMLNNGADINAVQQLLGHKSLATTQMYTHITYRELKHNYELAHPRALKKGG
ncbi:MAG: tyrosine-type recombinase/integrase [Muribaculaceae bacterium]|nr:tyrosine-type recombinase/integrase [Muribaculaceae bacterium]